MNEEFSLRFASSDVRIYAPALEEAKALSEEEKIQFLEYIHDPDIEEGCNYFDNVTLGFSFRHFLQSALS